MPLNHGNGKLYHTVLLIRQDRHPLQSSDHQQAINGKRTTERLGNELIVLRIDAIQRPTGHHLISPEKNNLPLVMIEINGLVRLAGGQELLQFPERPCRDSDRKALVLALVLLRRAAVSADRLRIGRDADAVVVWHGGAVISVLHGAVAVELGQHSKAVAIGGGKFKAGGGHHQVDTRENLLGLVGTGGKEGARQAVA